jgi:tRNA modification GTPase
MQGLRAAEPGEFTRRAFSNGRIDLAEAEGLADLLAAETEAQRRAALALAGGALSRRIEAWQQRILALAAELEASLDFADEDDVGDAPSPGWRGRLAETAAEIEAVLAGPPAERLRDGIRVAVAGPPNAGKSSLFNVLAGRDAAITSAVPGTTRDLVEAPTLIGGTAFLLTDTAGLRDSDDPIERVGVERARAAADAADLILWLGAPQEVPDAERSLVVHSKVDIVPADPEADIAVSAVTGEGVQSLANLLLDRARELLPREGGVSVNARHRAIIAECLGLLREAESVEDPLIAAEALRQARGALDRVTGRAGVEDMLDALFSGFCIGK